MFKNRYKSCVFLNHISNKNSTQNLILLQHMNFLKKNYYSNNNTTPIIKNNTICGFLNLHSFILNNLVLSSQIVPLCSFKFIVGAEINHVAGWLLFFKKNIFIKHTNAFNKNIERKIVFNLNLND